MIQTLSSLPLQTIARVLAALTGLSALWLLTVYRARVASVSRAIKRQSAEPFNRDPRPTPPGASVVVVAGDDAEALDRLLNQLFSQDYSGQMEVIVVNDGKNDDVKDVVTRIKHLEHRPNLYITFTPPGLRNVSHRKLALTLGIKAAHHPVILALTEQSCLDGEQWLARMMAPFGHEGVEVVIGTAMPDLRADRGMGKRYRSFILGADATEWLSAALRGKPYRADRCNMAFTRDAFFTSGGFNGALNLRDGDDDIFISRIARRDNTAVVCARQAAVTYGSPSARYQFLKGRPARFYSCRNLGRSTARIAAASSVAAWVMTLTAAAAIALGAYLADWITLGVAAALALGCWLTLTLTWRSTLRALRCRPAFAGIWMRMLRRPFTNAIHRMRSRARRADYHTWSA